MQQETPQPQPTSSVTGDSAVKRASTPDELQNNIVPKKKHSRKKIVLIAVGAAIVLLIAGGVYVKSLIGPGVDESAAGFSSQLLDQPSPIPSSSQADTYEDYCQIITPQMAEALGAVAPPQNISSFLGACELALPGQALVQISSVGPYGNIGPNDSPSFVEAANVAGLEARMYNHGAPLSGECTLNLNTRSVNSIIVNVRWNISNDLQRAIKRAESCKIAQQTAEILATAYVPLAGGKPLAATLQKPIAAVIDDNPCQVVGGSAALYAGVYDVIDDQNGRQQARQTQAGSCVYEHGGNKAVVTLDKSGKRLEHYVGSIMEGQITDRKLGVLPARQVAADESCSLAVEPSKGIILDVTYTASTGQPCQHAEVMQAVAIKELIDKSSVRLLTGR